MIIRMNFFVFIVVLTSFFDIGNACTMQGVSIWAVIVADPIKDVYSGVILSRGTTNVDGITVREFGSGLAGGPYVNVEHSNNQFIISTNEEYKRFEENEITNEISVTVDFDCTGGGQQSLVIIINIIDTNNNYPEFLPIPTDVYEFVISPPLRPGYLITGCSNDLIVRDIDLTTYNITFAIQENPYVQIELDVAGSAAIHRKEYKAILSTTSFIRTLEEPLELWISATDVDETGDEPLTTRARLRIVPDTEFVFPQEPIFSQTFYLAEYTKDYQLTLFQTIYLRQGYDAYVNFTLEGEYHTHFDLSTSTNNQISIVSLNTLPLEDISENQIYLILKADREYTSGDTATVIIRLPAATPLSFENPLYGGKIEDGNLDVPPLVLSQGYENKVVTAEVVGEYSTYFAATVEGNQVTLTTRGEIGNIIQSNNFIVFPVKALTDDSESNTVLSLDIIKDDNVTPLFDKPIYNLAYYPDSGLSGEQIVFVQGFDATVTTQLLGDHKHYFDINVSVTGVITITRSDIEMPEDIFDEQNIILSIKASKARTVGANAAIIIRLPEVSNELFNKLFYEGVLENDILSHETITLIGYSGTEIELFGAYSALFEARLSNEAVIVTAKSSPALPENVTHLTLELHAGTARAVLLINIQNIDIPIESFSKVLFEGYIRNDSVSHEAITLFDYFETEVELFGAYSELFEAVLSNSAVTVTARSFPLNLPEELTHLTFELRAGTAKSALLLYIETEDTPIELNESFSKVLFEGIIRNDVVVHESIKLSEYSGTEVELFGEYSTLFVAELANNAVTVNFKSSVTIPAELSHITLHLQAGTARAVLVLNIQHDTPLESNESFSKLLFEGVVRNNVASHETITLSEYTGTEVELFGEYSTLFQAVLSNDAVTVNVRTSVTLPTGLNHLTLELHAGAARAILLLNIENTDTPPESIESFSKLLYEGVIQNDTVTHESITLSGYSGTKVELLGEHSSLFESVLSNNTVTINKRLSASLPTGLSHLTLELHAGSARAVLLIKIENDDIPPESNETFSKILFEGVIENDVVRHESITLSGYSGTEVGLLGEHSTLFDAVLYNDVVTVNTRSSVTLPVGLTYITLELRAGIARSVLVLNIENTDSLPESNESFNKFIFEGVINNGVVNHEAIILLEYAGVEVKLFGEHSSLFQSVLTNDTVTINLRPSVTLPTELHHLTLELHAGNARAVLFLNIKNNDTLPESNESFSKVLFEGVIQNGIVRHELIILSGYSGTEVELLGEYAILFEASLSNDAVVVNMRSSVIIPTEVTHITLELQAGTARSVLVLSIENSDPLPESNESFSKVLYEGVLNNSVVNHETITLFEYSGTEVELFGEHSPIFEAILTNNVVTVHARSSVTLPTGLSHLTLELRAGTARAVLLLSIENADTAPESIESFSKVLFEGIIQNGIINHELITLTDYSGNEVELFGEYETLFQAALNNNAVTVTARLTPLTLPEGVAYLTLELRAGTARSILLLNIQNTAAPVAPVVTFSSESYAIRVDITQTGFIGQVQATADNEPINYSLQLDILHLGQRLSINNAGELHLSAPVSGGLYTFRVIGTTAFTQAVGSATVHLTVAAVIVCGDDLVMPPLITLERVEETPHHDLLSEMHEGCHFSIANRWPLNQNWLYVDETGLHTRAIDREHKSIAFMPLSQVQVEITLHCDKDDTRVKRSLNSDSLGPYDYGPNQWILTDSIPAYNSRTTLLNLIVKDINDNSPVFDEKPNEPIAVGYPIPELEAIVLPRSLTQLHATDADIDENAAIVYSSPNSELAVASLTGFVHVRNGAKLEQNALMTVHATDRNGQGNTGTIDLIVKLLDQSNIAVVTVRDAFLDDEARVISYLSDAVGYDVRVLRSVVVSQDDNDDSRRIKRETTNVSGASLELYIYGLKERDPVDVDVLTRNISNAASTITVNVANIVSLEDHLEGLEICAITERDTGLLVATIVLSVLLFIVIVLIAIWSFLKWRKNTYQKFDDTNSLASRGDSLDSIPKPEILPKARINPDELKKSERRLQDILDAPVEAITAEPIAASKSLPTTSNLIELPPQESNSPIVIQSIDKLKDADDMSDDEFGEIKKPRRKSVVTFNENVEKIIHVEDNEDSEDVTSDPDLEVYKF